MMTNKEAALSVSGLKNYSSSKGEFSVEKADSILWLQQSALIAPLFSLLMRLLSAHSGWTVYLVLKEIMNWQHNFGCKFIIFEDFHQTVLFIEIQQLIFRRHILSCEMDPRLNIFVKCSEPHLASQNKDIRLLLKAQWKVRAWVAQWVVCLHLMWRSVQPDGLKSPGCRNRWLQLGQ